MSKLIAAMEWDKRTSYLRGKQELRDLVIGVHEELGWGKMHLEMDLAVLEGEFIFNRADLEACLGELPLKAVFRAGLRGKLAGLKIELGGEEIALPTAWGAKAMEALRQERISKRGHLNLLSESDWTRLRLPIGLKHYLRTAPSLFSQGETSQRRMVVAGGKYEVDRYCPHKGADLAGGWLEDGHILVCPKHGWKFDLEADGQCLTKPCSIHAKLLW